MISNDSSEALAQEACDTVRAGEEKEGAERVGLTRDQAVANLIETFERIWRDFWKQHGPPVQP